MPTTQVTEITSSADAIAVRTDSSGSGVSPDWSAEERRMDHELSAPGVIKPIDAYQVVAGAAATMNIVVGSGAAKVDLALVQGDIAGQGKYLVRLDEVNKTIALDAADPSDPRIDEVYLVVYDNIYDSTSRSLPRFAVRKGDAASSPSVPGPDAAWEAFLLLSEVTIPAAAADILAATFADKRVIGGLQQIANGGYLPGGAPVFFTASGSFVKANHPGLRAVRIRCQAGGGGAGAATDNPGMGGGGGGGGYVEHFELASALSASETVTVGAGGAGGVGGSGANGLPSSFGAHCSSVGGIKGDQNGGSFAAGGGGSGDLIFPGGDGGRGGNPLINSASGQGGAAHLGAGAPGGPGGGQGDDANNYGGGGGAGQANNATNRDGGVGAPGIIIVDLLF